MTDRRNAMAFLAMKIGTEQLVSGEARDASDQEIIAHAMRRLADLRKQRQIEARERRP
jgi:hypothetical protein